ncbi:hypothetical protein GCM10010302_19390 [Streptomyces polychromogenes]|uniref:Uncharacterized protein n=1 Tax=Streptomyces polychromogenes TaxID=67342 RepID=A0ABN0V9E8_9ACTN
MSDFNREFTIRHGQMTRLPFGSFGGMSAVPARDGQPAKAKVAIRLPGGEEETRFLTVGATLDLSNGTWTVVEINGAGARRWAVRLRRND